MDTACVVITAFGILVTIYSIIITIKYSGLKKQTVQVGGGQQQAGGGQQQVVKQTAGQVTTINNYGTMHYNTETKGKENGDAN